MCTNLLFATLLRRFGLLAGILSVMVSYPLLFAHAQGWTRLTQMPQVVNSGFFFDESNGFIGLGHTTVSAPIGIYRTSDGGTTWNQCQTPSSYTGSVSSIFMADKMNGWASVLPWQSLGTARLWRTVDGGASWTENNSVGRGTGDCVYQTKKALILTDLDPGVQGGVSTDNGQSFNSLFPGRTTGIDFINDSVGIVTVFREGPWQKTTDGGVTWNALSIAQEAWSVYALKGTSSFYVAGETNHTSNGNVTIIRESVDAGDTWNNIDTFAFQTTGDIKGIGSAMYVQTDNESNAPSGILRSTDRGRSWTDLGGPQNWFDSRFVVASSGCSGVVIYAFDGKGGVYKYVDGKAGGYPGVNASMHTIVLPKVALGSQTTIPFAVDFTKTFNIDSLSRLATGLTYTLLFDDTAVSIQAVNPPSGWSLKSMKVNGDTLSISLTRLPSGALQNPATIGSIAFKAIAKSPQTTSFFLASIGLNGNWGDRNFCLSLGEGIFWGMRIIDKASVFERESSSADVQLYPNPTNGRVVLHIAGPTSESEVRLELKDLLGRDVEKPSTIQLHNGGVEFPLSFETLPAGTYEMTLIFSDVRKVMALIKR